MATPRTTSFQFGKRYLPEEWSEFVILKPLPLTMTSKAGQSRMYRTHRLEHLSLQSLPEDHFLREGPGLVQELIDTGLYPSKFRVLSLFGDPLYSSITRSMVPRVSLDASDEDIETSIIDAKNPLSKAADKDEKRTALASDPDVLAFARAVHGRFPESRSSALTFSNANQMASCLSSKSTRVETSGILPPPRKSTGRAWEARRPWWPSMMHGMLRHGRWSE